MSNKVDKRLDDVIPGQVLGIKVPKTKRHPEGDINRAILKWKRIVKDSGLLETVKELQEHKKRSVRRREVLNKAVYLQKRYNENNF
jgi:hypothetical protein